MSRWKRLPSVAAAPVDAATAAITQTATRVRQKTPATSRSAERRSGPSATPAARRRSASQGRGSASVPASPLPDSSAAARARRGGDIASSRMRVADPVLAASFWQAHRELLTAIGTIVVAIVTAQLLDRAIARRGKSVQAELSPVASTRLRLVRRLVYAAIIVLGLALALAQFAAVKRVATGVLASSAVLGLVVGFAARQTLANAVAGILLAITQPIRIGDLVTFKDETGTVEDVRLTYTYMRAEDGRRIIIPNEQLAQSTIDNHTIVDPRVRVEASVWVARENDPLRALDVLGEEPDVDVSIAEIDKDAVRIVAGTWASSSAERGVREAGLRRSCLERLAREGLSSAGGT